MLDGLFLESALTGLVADRAVERVIDEQELHHAFAAFFYEFTRGADSHVLGDRVCACDDRTRDPADGFESTIVALGLLSGGWARGHSHLHEAHPAISG